MRILMLTTSLDETNGYGVVSKYLRESLAAFHPGTEIQAYTSTDAGGLRFSRTTLRSELALGRPWLAPFLYLYDVLLVLATLKGKVDVIHVMVEHFAVAGMLLSRILGVPYVITAHGTYSIRLPKRFRLFRIAFANAAKVVAVSRFTARRMREEGVRADLEVVNWGVDKSVFNPGLPVAREKIVTFVGNFKPRKGFFQLLEAFRIVNSKDRGIKLQVIGRLDNGAKDYPRANALAREWGVNVEFLGPLDRSRLVECYRHARLNALPSKSEPEHFEGFGLIHLEANACGALTLGTLDSGNEDAIREGFGYLVPHGDIEVLAARILEAMSLEYPYLDIASIPDWRIVAGLYAPILGFPREDGSAIACPEYGIMETSKKRLEAT